MVDGEAKAAEAMHHSNPLYRQIGASSLVPEEATLHYQNDDIEDIYERMDNAIPLEKVDAYEAWVRALLIHAPTTDAELMAAMVTLRRQFRGQPSPKKFELLHVYNALLRRREIEAFPEVARTLVAKGVRSQSGVLVITVLTTPYPTVNGKKQAFSCQWDCYYCPNQPGQPRSYLRDEPAVLRANENGFDAVLQFTDRAATLAANGHPVDKIELLVLGGTWESYPRAYQETFVRDLFYAANTFWQRPKDKRARLALQEEININEHTAVKIIGLTLETRPDTISQSEIRRLRRCAFVFSLLIIIFYWLWGMGGGGDTISLSKIRRLSRDFYYYCYYYYYYYDHDYTFSFRGCCFIHFCLSGMRSLTN